MGNLKEYAKKIVRLMIVLWFIGAVFGAVVIVIEMILLLLDGEKYSEITVHLPELLNYIGLPVSGSIVGYLLKFAFLNKAVHKENVSSTEMVRVSNSQGKL